MWVGGEGRACNARTGDEPGVRIRWGWGGSCKRTGVSERWGGCRTSSVVDMNAASTPPLTPKAFATQNSFGSLGAQKRAHAYYEVSNSCNPAAAHFIPLIPRYTFVALVSLPSLIMALLIAWSVVLYLLSECLASSNPSLPLAGSLILAVP